MSWTTRRNDWKRQLLYNRDIPNSYRWLVFREKWKTAG